MWLVAIPSCSLRAADISYRFGRQCRTLHDVSQQRTTVLSLLAFAFVGIAVKLNLLVPFDQGAEAWTQRHITPLHTTLMLTVTELASTSFVSVVTALSPPCWLSGNRV